MFGFILLYSNTFSRDKYIDVAFVSIFLGGSLNLFQRLLSGCVVDYFNFFNLFVFNIQDVMITSATIYLVYRIFFNHDDGSRDTA
jgi:lipoprotein signal peptidase